MQQLDTRLRECYNELSPQEQRVASFIMDHFDDLMSYNSAELARLSGVSKATVSRLFKRLGYDRFKEMRDEVRTLRQSGMPLTENRDAVQGNTLLARHYKQEMANLTQWVNALDAVQFADVVQALGAAQRVPTVAISEPQAAGITTLARWHFGLPLDSVSAFDSYSSAMSLVNLLANALLHSALTEGRQRIHNIASLYTELDELEQR